MTKSILVVLFTIQMSSTLFGQKELIKKLNDDRIDFIESVDSLSDGSCMVTAHIAIAMTTGGWGVYYLNNGDVQKIESGHTVNYLNKGRYIKSGDNVYRLRVETKKKQYQYFADKLVNQKFEEPKIPFYVSDTFRHGSYFYSMATENVHLSVEGNSTLAVLYLDAPNFANPRLIKDYLQEEEVKNNLYGFFFETKNKISFANIIREDENVGTLLVRTLEKEGVQGVEYNLSFEFDIRSIMNAYLIGEELFIVYMDNKGNLHFSNFIKRNESFEPVSEAELELSKLLVEYENKDLSSLLSTLLSSYYELFRYSNKGENIHLLQMTTFNGKMDFFIFKIVNNEIIWASVIPRGLHIENSYQVVDKALDNTKFRVKFEDNAMIINDIEIGSNYTKNGEFLKAKNVVGFDRKIYDTEITINLEDGTHSRKIVKEL